MWQDMLNHMVEIYRGSGTSARTIVRNKTQGEDIGCRRFNRYFIGFRACHAQKAWSKALRKSRGRRHYPRSAPRTASQRNRPARGGQTPSRASPGITLPDMWKVRSLAAELTHAATPGQTSLGIVTPFCLANFARNGRQRHGMPLVAHLYTDSRSTFLWLSFESHSAISLGVPSFRTKSSWVMTAFVRIFFGYVKAPFSDDLTH